MSSSKKKQISKLLNTLQRHPLGLSDEKVNLVYKFMERFENPFQNFVNEVGKITNVSEDLQGIIEKYLRDPDLEKFVEIHFEGGYNPYKFKEDFLNLFEDFSSDYESLYDSVHGTFTILFNSYLLKTSLSDRIFQFLLPLLERDSKRLTKIVKTWPETGKILEDSGISHQLSI